MSDNLTGSEVSVETFSNRGFQEPDFIGLHQTANEETFFDLGQALNLSVVQTATENENSPHQNFPNYTQPQSPIAANDHNEFIINSSDSESLDILAFRRQRRLRRRERFHAFRLSSPTISSYQEVVTVRNTENNQVDLLDLADQSTTSYQNQEEVSSSDSSTTVIYDLSNRANDVEVIPNEFDHSRSELAVLTQSGSPPVVSSVEPESNILFEHGTFSLLQSDTALVSRTVVTPPNPLSTQSDFIIMQGQSVNNACLRQGTNSKRKLSSPLLSSVKKLANEQVLNQSGDDDDDGMSCSICFESWTNSGSHRLTSLKCGHVFGQKCIERWLKESHQTCPQCNAKAKKSDLRIIYAKKLVALDTTELEQALREIDKMRLEKRESEMELAKVRMQYHMAVEESDRLKIQVSYLQMQVNAYKDASPNCSTQSSLALSSNKNEKNPSSKMYKLCKKTVLTQSGGCRIMDFQAKTQQFVVSQPSPHATFMTGFGVKRLNVNDLKGGYFTLLHQKAIKDVRLSPLIDHHLLSASQDGTLRITDLMSNAKIHEYKLAKPVWSCCWDVNDRNTIYAGLSNGSIMQFDLRNTSDSLSSLENANSKCPIVSMYHLPSMATEHFQGKGGLLTATLEGPSFWHDIGSVDNQNPSMIADFKPVLLPLEPGGCTGLEYCSETQCFLTTYRPGRSYRATTHILCELKCQSSIPDASSSLACNIIDTYVGGQCHKMLTRNSLFVLPCEVEESRGMKMFACVGDQTKNRVCIYDSSKTELIQCISIDDGPPLDILPVHIEDTSPFLAVLSEKTLKLFQYN